MKREFVLKISAILICLLVIVGCEAKESSSAPGTPTATTDQTAVEHLVSDPVGEKAPDFALKDLDGKEFKLADLIDDKPLVLDFWASWCPPCRAKAPHFQELYVKYGDKLNIVGINLDRTIDAVKKYTSQKGLTFPNLYDDGGQVADKYGITGIPANVVINAQGEIIGRDLSIPELEKLAIK
ncbi:MAG: TlpA family protein disulfide reductase [Planctomycetes bacterium]|nr:TlpA family protein disulfide reductase [Planctomycetota bacterium]